ncbi:telomerase-binding protein EST1A isoform X2 [Anopheles darlingi]|uniref:telomerase-binding protein EST1A isoform X2 n=1 Tax=Anopheles darlingi TaxID=43151 RepID=UPI0021003B52|nr:telomerase-binding protein EST1A isoform X2 [Anopheles darlingi]
MSSEEDGARGSRAVITQLNEEDVTESIVSLASQLDPIEEMMLKCAPFIDESDATTMLNALYNIQEQLKAVDQLRANTSGQPPAETLRPADAAESIGRSMSAQPAPQEVANASADIQEPGTSRSNIPTSAEPNSNRPSGGGNTSAPVEKEMFVRQRDGTYCRITVPAQNQPQHPNANAPANTLVGGRERKFNAPKPSTSQNPVQLRRTAVWVAERELHASMPSLTREELPAKLLELSKQLCDMQLGSDPWERWPVMQKLRYEFFTVLQDSMARKMNFVQESNIENTFWRDHCHTIVGRIRNQLKTARNTKEETRLLNFLCVFIEESRDWFLRLLKELQIKYSFLILNFIGKNAASNTSGLKYGLALVSAQKLCLFIGDLGRYQLELKDASPAGCKIKMVGGEYGYCKRWYEMARDIIPKNARPYNQLALLAIRDRKFFEAVYLYSRCLMASNPYQSAWEGLLDLFDTARKKFETTRAEDEAALKKLLQESEANDQPKFDWTVCREVWIHPADQTRMQRQLPAAPQPAPNRSEMADVLLASLPTSKLEQQFYYSFVHMVGMIATKTGMEVFSQCAEQVLREFRLLLTTMFKSETRLLELSALLMFAMEKAKHLTQDDGAAGGGKRLTSLSELQLRAISVMQPFLGLIIERILQVATLGVTDWWMAKGSLQQQEQVQEESSSSYSLAPTSDAQAAAPRVQKRLSKKRRDAMKAAREQRASGKGPLVVKPLVVGGKVSEDATGAEPICDVPTLLAAVKIWCDWLSCNEEAWNTAEHGDKYKLWNWCEYEPWPLLAALLNQLSKIKTNWLGVSLKKKEDYILGRLPEDIFMAGFLPLAESVVTPIYLPVTVEMDMDPKTGRAVHALRVYQVLQFGHWLCGQKSSVLGLQSSGTPDTHFVYVTQQPSSSGGGDAPHGSGGTDAAAASDQQPSIDDGEENLRLIARVPEERHRLPTVEEENQPPDADSSETSQLAHRMQELKRQKAIQERYDRRRQQLLQPGAIKPLVEVRPKFLVPDTNCFVDDLRCIKAIAKATNFFTLMVPIVVLSELRGLSMGAKNRRKKLPAVHMAASAARPALGQPQTTTANQRLTTNVKSLHHSYTVTQNAANALEYLKEMAGTILFVTTKGSVLRKTIFTTEEEEHEDGQRTNDDRILETSLNLVGAGPSSALPGSSSQQAAGKPRKIVREVVLLTKDRNLRVKALSHDVPVRDMHGFAQWAGLQLSDNE